MRQEMEGHESPSDRAIVPAYVDGQLAVSTEPISRGLDIAARIEYSRHVDKYSKPQKSLAVVQGSGFVDFSRHGEVAALVEAGANPRIFIVDTFTGETKVLSSLEEGLKNLGYLGDGRVWSVSISDDGRSVAVGYSDADVLCWDVKSGRVLSRSVGSIFSEPVSCLRFSPDGESYVAYGSYDHLNVYDTASARFIRAIPTTMNNEFALAFTDDGSQILIGGVGAGTNGGLLFMDPFKKYSLFRDERDEGLSFRGSEQKCIAAVAIFAGNQRVLSMDESATVTVWDVMSGEAELHWRHSEIPLKVANGCPAGSVAVSANGKRILSAGGDNYMRLWTTDGTQISEHPHDSPVLKVAFSADGRRALSGCGDSVSVWELP